MQRRPEVSDPRLPAARFTVTFSKTGPLIYIGNRDLLSIWERSCRRAGLGIAYSHGFHPQPRLHLASALPLGYSSEAEVLDLFFYQDASPEAIAGSLRDVLPAGISVQSVERRELSAPALQAVLAAADFEVRISAVIEASDLAARIRNLIAAAELQRERRGKPYNLRPLIEILTLRDGDRNGPHILDMRLSARESATGRPEEVVFSLGLNPENCTFHRTRLVFRD